MQHELKTWVEPFTALLDGRKRFEIRKADRPFRVGDSLLLREWSPAPGIYTGRSVVVKVTYLFEPGEWGLPKDLCVMGISAPAGPASRPLLLDLGEGHERPSAGSVDKAIQYEPKKGEKS